MSYKKGTSGTVQDWATRAAQRVAEEPEGHTHVPRIAAIIATFAEPWLKLLRESRRDHYHCDDSWYCCGKCSCGCLSTVGHYGGDEEHEHDDDCYPSSHGGEAKRMRGVCNCGADGWNKKIDEALK